MNLLQRSERGVIGFVPGFERALWAPMDAAASVGDVRPFDALVRLSIVLKDESVAASRALLDLVKAHAGAVRLLRAAHRDSGDAGKLFQRLTGAGTSRRGPQYGQRAPDGTLKASSFVDPGRMGRAPGSRAQPSKAPATVTETPSLSQRARRSAGPDSTGGSDAPRRRFRLDAGPVNPKGKDS